MELSSRQDALIELRSVQLQLENDRKNGSGEDLHEVYEERVESLFECLELDPRSRMGQIYAELRSQPGKLLGWLDSVEGAWALCRLHDEGLPNCVVTLTENDRKLLLLMLELKATSPANPKPAEVLMAGIGGGDHKKAFDRLKRGGYTMSDTGRGKGWWLTSLGIYEAKSLAPFNQNGTL